MSKYVILGSNSFSGSNLINKLLTRRDTVLGLSRSEEKSELYLPYKKNSNIDNFSFIRADINSPKQTADDINAFEPDYIVNYAALNEVFPSIEHPGDYYDTNVSSTAKMLDYIRKKDYLKRYLQFSTCEVYGNCNGLSREEEKLNPTTPYAVSKAAMDMHLLTMHKHLGFPITITRSTSVFGRHQQLFKIVPRTIINLLEDNVITVHNNGQMIRTFVHIDDVSEGVIRAIEIGKAGEIYNLSSEERYSILFVIKTIARIMKRLDTIKLEFVEARVGQDEVYQLDYMKARRELGWTPRTNFEWGIMDTVNWIKENYKQIRLENKEYIHKV